MKVRSSRIDNCKAVLIIAVVLGHFGSTGSTIYNSFIVLLFSFHMPLFLFISGYLSKKVEHCRERAVKDFLLLFLAAQILWIVYKALICGDYYYITHMSEPGFGLWYILAIFVYRILLKDLIRIKYLFPAAVLASSAVMAMVNVEYCFDIQRIVGFMVYFILGYFMNEEMFLKMVRIPRAFAATGLLLIGGAIYYLLDRKIIAYDRVLAILKHQLTVYEFENIWIGFLIYLLIIPLSIAIGGLVLSLIPDKKTWFTYIGEDTLPLYLSHTYIVVLYRDYLKAAMLETSVSAIVLFSLTWLCIMGFSSGSYRKIFHIGRCHLQGFFYKEHPVMIPPRNI